MFKMSKIVLALLLAVSLLLTAIGCKSEESKPEKSKVATTANSTNAETTQSVETKPADVTLSIMVVLGSPGLVREAINGDDIMKELSKVTGVTLDWTPTITSDDVNKVIPIKLAANELPDIVCVNSADLMNSVKKANAAIPLEGLLKTNGQNIIENCSDAIEFSRLTRGINGELYFIPSLMGKKGYNPEWPDKGWSIRWDLYKQLNYPKLETVDDLFNVLKQMMESEPKNADGKKNYGFGNFFGESWGWSVVGNAIMYTQGYVKTSAAPFMYDMNADKPIGAFSDINGVYWQTLMRAWNKAWRMGILDPESLTLKFAQYQEKAQNGRYFAAILPWLGPQKATGQFATNGTPEKGFVPVPVGANKENAYIFADYALGSHLNYFISKNCKTPERAMDLFNYLAGYDGAMLLENGVKGLHYTIENKEVVPTEISLKARAADEEAQVETGLTKYSNLALFSPLSTPEVNHIRINDNPEYFRSKMNQVEKDYVEHYGYDVPIDAFTKNIKNYTFDVSIGVSLTMETGSDLADKEAQITQLMGIRVPKLIFQDTEEAFEKEMKDLVDQLNSMGVKEIEQYYIDKYNALNEQLK